MSKYNVTQSEISAGARALFLTIQVHEAAADALSFNWDALPTATRQPWMKASRAVLIAAQMAEKEATK